MQAVTTEVQERLAQSLHNAVWLVLGMEQQDYRVQRPFSATVVQQSQLPLPLNAGTRIVEVFDSCANSPSKLTRQMLILGEPGAGKTTMMLELAEDLLQRSTADKAEPIPVLLSLSSWKNPKQPIFEWLLDELKAKYGIRQELAQQWLEKNQLLPLLDGLDEVKAECRESCVQALNQFIQEYRQTEMVVCSYTKDYEALSQRLMLQTAIYLQPHLPKVNPKLVIDRAALQKVIAPLGALLAISLLLVNILPPPKPPSPSREDTYLVVNWAKNGKDHLAIRRGGCVLMDLNFIDNIFKRIPDVQQCYGNGDEEDQYLVGDWDGNGIDELAYRSGNRLLRNLENSDNSRNGEGFGYGNEEYLVGDWDGDRRDSLAIRTVGNNHCVTMKYTDGRNPSSKAWCYDDISIDKEDKFLAGDWDGDGRDSLAVRKGNCVHIDSDSDTKLDKQDCYKNVDIIDQFLVGDWDGDGKDNVSIRKGNHVFTLP